MFRRGLSHERNGCAGTGLASIAGRRVANAMEIPANRRYAMKLSSEQVTTTLSQFNAQVLPDDHPGVVQLRELFGDHTFFLDNTGLNVLEPAETAERDEQTGQIVSLADWSDDTLTSLRPHEPSPTGVLVALGVRH
jgi:hypothetical protein